MVLADRLLRLGVPESLLVFAEYTISRLDEGVDFFADVWNILSWETRPGNRKAMPLRLDKLENQRLRIIAKIYIAEKRVNKRIGAATAFSLFYALLKLDKQICMKDITKINMSDFEAIQLEYARKGFAGKVATLTFLQAFANWLRLKLGLAIKYDAPKVRIGIEYGRHGTEEGRSKKLIATEIIARLFSLAQDPYISLRDRFFLNAVVVAAATGLRVNELACLPENCLVEQAGKWVVKLFPEKGGQLVYRSFPQDLHPAVESAIEYIRNHTSEGRAIARRLKESPGLNWPQVRKSEKALIYFSRKFASQWLQRFSLFTPRGVYFRTADQFVDAIGLKLRFGTAGRAAEYLGTSHRVFKKLIACQEGMIRNEYMYEKPFGVFHVLDSTVDDWKARIQFHPHVPTVSKMEEFYEVSLKDDENVRLPIINILDEAIKCQLDNALFLFVEDAMFEKCYELSAQPLVRNADKVLLEPGDALFVIPRNFLNPTMPSRTNQYTPVCSTMFSGWLSDCCEKENSLFVTNRVIDPNTGDVAKFTWHDLRHWLDTTYKQGGLSDLQVNIILGRKDHKQGEVYDHTPALDRSTVIHKLMEKIRQNEAIGMVQDTFNEISLTDRKSAEEFLRAAVRVVNPMPHGGCLHNLALKPCPHSLSCLVDGTSHDPCDHLVIDSNNEAQFVELKWVKTNAETMQKHFESTGGELSPQYEHFQNVANSAGKIIDSIVSKKRD